MKQRHLKTWYFGVAALNTYATSCFLNYLFFFTRDRFGFGNRQNLWLSALYGFVYIFAARLCGKFAQRRGLLMSLKLGCAGLAAMMVAGALFQSAFAEAAVLVFYGILLLFTWPALEALVSQNESQAGVKHNVGVYNCSWAAAAAAAYFTGGPLYDWLGAGVVFWIPAAIFFIEFLLAVWLGRQIERSPEPAGEPAPEPAHPESAALRQPVAPETFLKMAWLANPFAYVAIQTVFAVMPGVAEKLRLSTTQVGLFCSVWLFARLGTFALLWHWDGWHYRFRWLLVAFAALTGSFALLLLAPQLWLVVAAQLGFGFATGLIYYSSLFYSMDVGGETQAEHGGMHEAAIGVGICAGPAVGAASLQLLPQHSSTGVFAVSALLLAGLGGLLLVWRSGKKVQSAALRKAGLGAQ